MGRYSSLRLTLPAFSSLKLASRPSRKREGEFYQAFYGNNLKTARPPSGRVNLIK